MARALYDGRLAERQGAHTDGGPAPTKLLIVAGPTASGKSALASSLAQALDGTVINADSLQVYRDLPILTAQPGPEERARAPHLLYGALDGDDPCSAARWAELATVEITGARTAGRLAILVGGSGLYLTALLQGLAAVPPVPEEIRREGESRLQELGHAEFRIELALLDPEGAARIRGDDTQRLVRAWAVARATGHPLDHWQRLQAAAATAYDAYTLLLQPPRPALYSAIDARFRIMVGGGALEEVAALRDRCLPPDRPILKAQGVPDLMRYLAGEITFEHAVQHSQQTTRNYAKRQTTWFKHQLRADLDLKAQFSETLCAQILPLIRHWHLT